MIITVISLTFEITHDGRSTADELLAGLTEHNESTMDVPDDFGVTNVTMIKAIIENQNKLTIVSINK